MKKVFIYLIFLMVLFPLALKTVMARPESSIGGGRIETSETSNTNTTDACKGYLGETDDPNDPAYYLSFAFKVIKYVAIIMLFVLTVLEYVKAIPSGDNDAIKKATQKTVKRIIIAIIIFFLPMLIEFILTMVGLTNSGTCNIH